MKNLKKYALLSISALLTVTTLVGCSNGAKTIAADNGGYYDAVYACEAPTSVDYSYLDDYGYYETEEDYYSSGTSYSASIDESQITASTSSNRKLIKTVNINIETIEYDKFIAGLNEEIAKLGGYIETEYSYNGSIYNKSNKEMKHCSLTVRIPDDKIDDLVSTIGGSGNITQKTTSTEDVTLSYVDTESKKEMYLAEQESLLALLEKAETIEDIAYLTERITQVRYNIESMESSLRVYDDLVQMATININVDQVEVYTPSEVVEEEKTIGQKISEGFHASLMDVLYDIRDFFVGLIIASPYIIRFFVIIGIIVGIIVAIVKIIKFNIKRSKKKKAEANKKLQETKEKEKEEK